jgi:lipid-binding SYLF domain-containing protein
MTLKTALVLAHDAKCPLAGGGVMKSMGMQSIAAAAVATIALLACTRDPSTAADAKADARPRAQDVLADATVVLRGAAQTAEIPRDRWERARCVVVIPQLVSGGLVLGARRGRGVVSCRTAPGWSGPAFVTLTGGSAGLQVGLESADVVMLVTSDRGMSQLFRSSFQLGADTSAAAGPAGKSTQAGTDSTMTAEVVAYARSRGLFAGVEVSGAVVKQDREATDALYPGSPSVQAILGGDVPAPKEAQPLLDQLREMSAATTGEGRATARVTAPDPSPR